MKLRELIEQIIDDAGSKPSFQEACYYIASELEKIIPDWSKRNDILYQIEKDYNLRLVY